MVKKRIYAEINHITHAKLLGFARHYKRSMRSIVEESIEAYIKKEQQNWTQEDIDGVDAFIEKVLRDRGYDLD